MRTLVVVTACAVLLCASAATAGKGNITIVGGVPIPGSVFVTDVWGYYDSATGKEYAITGDDVLRRIYIIDVTDPGSAGIKATINDVAAFDMKVWGHYIYSCDGDADFFDSSIIDISNPLAPVKTAAVFQSAHNIAISDNGLMILEYPGMVVYDLKPDPLSPTFVVNRGRGGHDATIHGSTVYDFHNTVTNIWDMSTPATPALLGSIDYGGVTYNHSGDVTGDGRYLFICDELSIAPLPDFHVFDISNLASPVHVAQYGDDNATIHNLYIVDDIAYVAYYSAGFRTFDVSDPTTPVMFDEVDTSGDSGEGFTGAFGVYPWLPSGRVLVSDWDGGLYIFEVDRGTATPVAISSFDAYYENGAVRLHWEIFADEPFEGFRVYRAAEAGHPVPIATLPDPARRSFTDTGLTAGTRVRYTLSALQSDGSEVRSRTVDVRVPGATTSLNQNHPNPFNPTTTISWQLARAGRVSLRVFDARGRLVRTLVDDERGAGAGSAQWNGNDDRGRPVPSGVYFYRLRTGSQTHTRRMTLVK